MSYDETLSVEQELDRFMKGLIRRNPGELEFHQAVHEVAATIIPFIHNKPHYRHAHILERMTEPDRIITFRVCWEDDDGNVRVNRGYRVQCNNAIGPYKGGLRFHHEVKLDTLKFLAFEQTFKNSLTGLPMGGGKGGSDFNPKGKTDSEVMRFCQAFMIQLARHIGQNIDVPAGDIGVGAREIGYLFGQHKRLTNEFTGVLTGKGLSYGGSLVRQEATGYGAVYFLEAMLKEKDDDLKGKTAVISGSGNVATFAAKKLMELGAKVVTLSDSSGFIHDPDGLTMEKLNYVIHLKTVERGRISEYAEKYGVKYYTDEKPWGIPCDVALPCATQNEINEEHAKQLVKNGCKAVSEGANMPTEDAGVKVFLKAHVMFAPSKAANAGGVAMSGLEMSQNSARMSWTEDNLNKQLREIMSTIHGNCVEYGREGDYINYVKGANIGGFIKVADAMLAYGVI